MVQLEHIPLQALICVQAVSSQNVSFKNTLLMCCVFFSEDNQWYRAKVLSYPSEEHVCVDYLDFGNSEMAKLEHLRPISAPLLAVPIQAIPCGLAGIYFESFSVTV